MFDSSVDDVKNRLSVTDVVGQYIKLQKAGVNYRAVCPFHGEKKPSFFVSPARQIWHCFGCGAGGGIFDFVMKIEGVEFGDALRILAQKAGIELKRQDPQLRTERQRLYEICELATRFFEKQLAQSKAGQEAMEYLLDRKINGDSIKKWRIGYAPDAWAGLSDFMVGQGYAREEMERAGLAIRKEDGQGFRFFDRFRSRIMFPICDVQGQVIGFGGRVFKSDDPAKYVNTPATILYDKSRVLYGLDKAKVDIRKQDACILVEGYVDAIMVVQSGYENVVATSGTALTPYQLQILKRYSENIFTAFDMDVAGDNATKRGIDLAQAHGFNVKIIVMPQGKDPADVSAENPADFGELQKAARSIMDFYFESARLKFDLQTADGKKAAAKMLLPVLKRIPNSIELAHWRQKMAAMLRVNEEDITEELKKVPRAVNLQMNYGDFTSEPNLSSAQPKSRKEILEERVVSLLLKYKDKVQRLGDHHRQLFSEPMQAMMGQLYSPALATAPFGSAALNPMMDYLILRAESEEDNEEAAEEEISVALVELSRLTARNKLESVAAAIKEAEETNDSVKMQSLLQEFNQLSQELHKNS